MLWDDDVGPAMIERQIQLDRAVDALESLPTALVALAVSNGRRGDFAVATALITEGDSIAEAPANQDQTKDQRPQIPPDRARRSQTPKPL